MPFFSIHLPSIALTQIKTVLSVKLHGQVDSEIFYLNQDFAQFLGLGNYDFIAHSVKSTVSGLGDWFFRQIAFPEVADNREVYNFAIPVAV
jgi:magnesium-protoporphyrin IX monomethyl ester (oxidative) cyclase